MKKRQAKRKKEKPAFVECSARKRQTQPGRGRTRRNESFLSSATLRTEIQTQKVVALRARRPKPRRTPLSDIASRSGETIPATEEEETWRQRDRCASSFPRRRTAQASRRQQPWHEERW